ncbi:hypothetical protein O181_003068 [Austropuccinia psidii MF-1]|uniref:Ino eighty subunit 1 n=1 Tax=Austropuccinia psidii MF-1 TaxID=1389203 RepID=A0A9Q3BDQ5_9BASI|nr:hypothetical protein [Austropuccinia psidii MF-1]
MPAPKKNRALLPNCHPTSSSSKDASGWALKKADGEMFTRADIQYDLMSDIFNDRTFQFTSPLDQRAVSFKELYVESLSKFSKAAKSTIRQLEENPVWATNFCIASFLINIGRINTTVAFYPELRAYMRTYHPIPCLQKDEYCQTNLQDAPRIKTMLKTCVLPFEPNKDSDSLMSIAHRSAQGYRPPTTVVNLIFELFNNDLFISRRYFPEGFVLHDLFSPTTIPTKLRAYAFLWLMHHFLEDPSSFVDFEADNKVGAFQLARLEDLHPGAMIGNMNENVDTEEELKWGKDMQLYRLEFLKKWRGEEGIGFVDDLVGGNIAGLTEDPSLTKKQKVMVQNFAQSTLDANDQHQATSTLSGTQQSGLLSTMTNSTKPDQRNGPSKEHGKSLKAKTVTKTRITHVERLQSSLDAMAKYGDDSDLDALEDQLTPIQLAWQRNQNDLLQDRDVAYDSDDPTQHALPDWKPKELKRRLIGFAFPVEPAEGPEEERKDKVIRYVGVKKRNLQHTVTDGHSGGIGGGGGSAVGTSHPINPTGSGQVPPVKQKRKRRAVVPPPQTQPPPTTAMPTETDQRTWYHAHSQPVPVE